MREVRFASPADAGRIVEVFRAGFDPVLLPFTILGCSGVQQFVLDTIQLQFHGNQAVFVVFTEDDYVIGAAEFRRDLSSIFLNHIYVDKKYRGKGVGTRLLSEGLKLACDHQQEQIELDVFSTNDSARHWYESLGLTYSKEQIWLEIPVMPLATDENVWWITNGLTEANRLHPVFGFSQFTVKTIKNDHSIGRLGSDVFRYVGSQLFQDAALLNALMTLDSHRKILLIRPSAETLPEGRVLAVSYRLSGRFDAMISQLDRRQFYLR